MTTDMAKDAARALLSDERFYHTECVSECAVMLAKRYNIDAEKAAVAGYLHDIAKELPAEDLLQMAGRSDIIDVASLAKSPQILHSYAGGVFIKERYDPGEDIVRAVSFHTTGRAGMTDFEKIIYLADYISADRGFKGVEEVRRIAEVSLDAAVASAAGAQLVRLVTKGRMIHPDSLAFYNDVIEKSNEQRT